MTGTRLGRYRVLEKIGSGGMGEVYRAHDDDLDRDVAVKLLPAASVADPAARARLLREARAAAALNHPAICTVHEVGEADGRAYIAMELLDGTPLSDRVHGPRLPIDEVVRWGCQIAAALAHAHARQVVHRDLKCANIMVSADGRIKVLDFGLARRIGGPQFADVVTQVAAPLTEPGSTIGTPAYMAPEQLRGEPADARSDIWALGVVLYEGVAGARPFAGKSAFELSARILNDAAPVLPSGVPPALRAIIDRCLEKEPARRYQSAGEVQTALEAVGTGVVTSRTEPRPRLWRPPMMVAAGALVLALAAVAFNLDAIRRRVGGAPRIESLAVLPLENLSGDAAQDFFADGMTEVLSTDLARLGGLKRVTARGSVIRYKGLSRPLREIANELNVDALITGSVQRSGDRVSITAQLLDPATGDQLWSNRYERDLRDVLALRNEIVSAIVREIKAQLSPADRARLSRSDPVNPEAFEAALKGRFHWLKQTREDYDLAERYYNLALEKDPDYALGYAGLATVWMMRGDAGFQPPSETLPKAMTYIARALELDDDLAELHVAVGGIKTIEWDLTGSGQEYRRAIELNPNSADAHFFYADLLLLLKRPAEWQQEIQRALEIDPLNDFNRSFYGWHLNYLERYDEAIKVFERLLPTAPNKSTIHLGLWGAYFRKGMYGEALTSAREYFLAAGDSESAGLLGEARDRASYRAAMRHAGDAMAARSATRHVPAIRVARMYAHSGDADNAFRWLEQAYANRESPLVRLGVFWDWHDLRTDPRFHDLLRRLKLPQ